VLKRFYALSQWPDQCGQRYVGGADVLAVGQGGQPLHVYPEQFGERLGLGLAQLREPSGDVLYRTVPLAQLLTRGRMVGRVPVVY
jgi:hypothetical protein